MILVAVLYSGGTGEISPSRGLSPGGSGSTTVSAFGKETWRGRVFGSAFAVKKAVHDDQKTFLERHIVHCQSGFSNHRHGRSAITF
jgi:hypothetical protein